MTSRSLQPTHEGSMFRLVTSPSSSQSQCNHYRTSNLLLVSSEKNRKMLSKALSIKVAGCHLVQLHEQPQQPHCVNRVAVQPASCSTILFQKLTACAHSAVTHTSTVCGMPNNNTSGLLRRYQRWCQRHGACCGKGSSTTQQVLGNMQRL